MRFKMLPVQFKMLFAGTSRKPYNIYNILVFLDGDDGRGYCEI
jgi:hypothetical protein